MKPKFILFVTILFVLVSILVSFNITFAAKNNKTKIAENNSTALFHKANNFYEKGKYSEAINDYQLIIKQGINNYLVFYNLGNAYFKNRNIGAAILNYEKAEKLAPRDHDLQQNLKLALSQTKDKMEAPNPSIFINVLKKVYDYFTLNEWTIIMSGLFFIICIFIIVRMLINSLLLKELILYFIVSALLVFVITSFFFIFKISGTLYSENAVVMQNQVQIYSGPAETYTVLLKVHEGTRMKVMQKQQNWYRVHFINGYEGWLSAKSVELY